MSKTTVQTVSVGPEKTIYAAGKVQLENEVRETSSPRQIWWTNAIFFIAFHVVGFSAWYTWPSSWRTWFLCYINWQLGTLGITIGIPPVANSRRLSSIMESSKLHRKTSPANCPCRIGHTWISREYTV
jgi:hypothetical protein